MNDFDSTNPATSRSARRWGTGAALVAAGLAGGLILAGTVSANAATSTPTPSASSGTSSAAPQAPLNPGDPTKPQRSDESLLTGTTLDQVLAAAKAKYPDATVQRAETDSDGVYEVHMLKADGTPVTVEIDASFTVTGEEAGGPGGMGGHNGMGGGGVDPDPNDNDGPGTGIPGGTGSSSATSSSSASA